MERLVGVICTPVSCRKTRVCDHPFENSGNGLQLSSEANQTIVNGCERVPSGARPSSFELIFKIAKDLLGRSCHIGQESGGLFNDRLPVANQRVVLSSKRGLPTTRMIIRAEVAMAGNYLSACRTSHAFFEGAELCRTGRIGSSVTAGSGCQARWAKGYSPRAKCRPRLHLVETQSIQALRNGAELVSQCTRYRWSLCPYHILRTCRDS